MSRTATRVLLAAVLAIILASLITWVSWLTLSTSQQGGKKAATAATLAASTNRKVTPMDTATCIALEHTYLAAHPERTDLHVNGNDCNYTYVISVGAPPGQSGPGVTPGNWST